VPTLTNNFEGSTSGTTITTGNSGGTSGNAFDVVTIGGTSTLTYDSTHAAHGTLSAKVTEPPGAVNCFLEWTTSLTGTSLSQAWFRCYIYLTAFPATSTVRVVRALNSATFLGGVGITTAGKVVTVNSAGATQTTSTAVVPTNQWFRLEGYIIGSASAGQIQVEIFTSSMDAVSPDETDTTGSAINTANTITALVFGNPSSQGSYTFWLDDLGASSTGYIGPALFTVALAAAPHPAGAVRRNAGKTLAAHPAALAAAARTTRKNAAAAAHPAGALARSAAKKLAAAPHPAGTLARSTRKALAAVPHPAGALARTTAITRAAKVTAAGALGTVKTLRRVLAAAVHPAGSLSRGFARTLAARVASAAGLRQAGPSPSFTAGLPEARWETGSPMTQWHVP
jgi:hypothetical protein